MDSTSFLEISRNKFYETKNKVDSKLGDHLSRSRNLLSDVNRSLKKSVRDDSVYSQRYFLESFVPFKENNDPFILNNEAYRCKTRLASPTFMSKGSNALGLSETPRHMTQAMWLLNTSNVSCKLSNNPDEDEDEKVPEILLKDPADLLRGDKGSSQVKSEDKLTEMLNDKSCDYEESTTPQDDSNNSISYDIVSSLNLCKKTHNNNSIYGSSELVNKLLNDSYNSLEDLTKMFTPNHINFNSLNFDTQLKSYDCPGTKSALNNFEEMITQEFVNNSGIDFNKHHETLTKELLELNEQDKLREFQLAPKVFTNEEQSKKSEKEPKKIEFKSQSLSGRDTTTGLETDLLGSFTIIRDGKSGRKMYRLSDFDKKFNSSSKLGNSVQVQTEDLEQEPPLTKKKFNTNVKIVYNNFYERSIDLRNHTKTLKTEDLYAKQIVSNLVPKLEMKLNPEKYGQTYTKEFEKIDSSTNLSEQIKEYNSLLKLKEKEKMDRWRAQRAPIMDLVNLNLKSGIRNSTLCRGGKRNTKFLHNVLDNYLMEGSLKVNRRGLNAQKESQEDLSYISPSNRKTSVRENYYGYDLSEEHKEDSLNTVNKKENYGLYVKRGTMKGKLDEKKGVNPMDNFEKWWGINTEQLNMIREQLSM